MLTLLAPAVIMTSIPRRQRRFSSQGCIGLSMTFEKDAMIPRLLLSKKAPADELFEFTRFVAGTRGDKRLVNA